MSLTNAISYSQFNTTLSQIQRISGLSPVTHRIGDLAFKAKAAQTTTLGHNVGQVLNGIESLTSETDYLGDDETIEGTGTARLNNIPGMEDNFKTTPSDGSSLSAITGSSAASASSFLREITTGTSPVAISGAIKKATGITPPPALLGAITTSKFADKLSLNLLEYKTIANDINRETAFYDEAVGSVLNFSGAGTSGGAGILNVAALNTNNVLSNEVNSLTKGKLSDVERGQVTTLLLLNKNKEAAGFVSDALKEKGVYTKWVDPDNPNNTKWVDPDNPDTTYDALGGIEESVFNVDPSLNNVVNNIQKTSAIDLGVSSVPAYEMGTDQNNWYKKKSVVRPAPRNYFTPSVEDAEQEEGTFQFRFIDTYEELYSDLRAINRDITEVVIHWSDTFIDQGGIGSEELHEWSNDGIEYHYVIKRNGDIQKGCPANETSLHAEGHEKYSIAICLIAGYSCPAGTENLEKYYGDDSITAEQWKTLASILSAFYVIWPGGQVWGHNDISDEHVDPGFDVSDFIYKKFGKRNATLVASSSSLSPSELISLPPLD